MTNKRKQAFSSTTSLVKRANKKVVLSTNVDSELLPVLSEDVLSHVMGMLHPRELLMFVSTCKSFIKMVTHGHVIRGGVVMQKLRVKKNLYNRDCATRELEAIMKLIRDQSIFIPSPMRFLRLLLGTRCERCSVACQMQSDICVYVCNQCKRDTAFRLPFPSIGYYGHKRIAGNKYPISRPYYARDGERCGPLVSVMDIVSMAWDGRSADNFLLSLDACPDDDATQRVIGVYDDALTSYKCVDEDRTRKALAKQAKAMVEQR